MSCGGNAPERHKRDETAHESRQARGEAHHGRIVGPGTLEGKPAPAAAPGASHAGAPPLLARCVRARMRACPRRSRPTTPPGSKSRKATISTPYTMALKSPPVSPGEVLLWGRSEN